MTKSVRCSPDHRSGCAPPGAERLEPASAEEAAAALARAERPLRITGGDTKSAWAPPDDRLVLSTVALREPLEHNPGDLTAVVGAGVPLAEAQAVFARAGQMLALDPPDPGRATVGGVVAAGDSGPLRGRYGAARDLVLGVEVALSDGTLARAGGRVIKNVAGYDLPKLFSSSRGSLGLICELCVRLHPLPETTATAAGGTSDPNALSAAALELSHAPLEAQSLDVRWGGGDGALLARFGGASPRAGAEAAARLMGQAGLSASIVEDDDAIWARQREGQRLAAGTVVRVSGLQTGLPGALAATSDLGGRLVGRAAPALWWIALEDHSPADAAAAVAELRRRLAPSPCSLLDAPPEVRAAVPAPAPDPALHALTDRLKRRFDPRGLLPEPPA